MTMKIICLFFIIVSTVSLVHSQSLSQSELTSAIWLIRQYQIGITQNEDSICSSNTFTCSILNQSKHITAIALITSPFVDGGPLPLILSFDFPALKSFDIRANQYTITNASVNLLSLTKNFPLLTDFSVENCPSINTVPLEFPLGMPSLVNIMFTYVPNLKSIPSFFNQTSAQTISILGCPVQSVGINNNIYLPNIWTISLSLSFTLSNYTIEFTDISFPKLNTIEFLGRGTYFLTMNINSKILQYVGGNTLDPSMQGGYIINFLYPSSVLGITNSGINSIINPSDYTLYKILSTLQITNHGLTSVPNLPSSIGYLGLMNNNIKSFPATLPPSITSIDLRNNGLVGTVPAGMAGKYSLYLNANPNVIGSLPEEFCSLTNFDFTNTSISSIPNCFWCFYNPLFFITSLTKPSDLNCKPKIDSTTLITFLGVTNITGTGLGWGRNMNITGMKGTYFPTMVNVNTRLMITFLFGEGIIKQNFNITFNTNDIAGSTFSFTSTEVGMFVQSMNIINRAPELPLFNVTFNTINPDYPPTSIMIANYTCVVKRLYDNGNLLCQLNGFPREGSYTPIFTNQYGQYKYGPFVYVRDPTISSVNLEPTTFPPQYMNFFGYFGENTTEDSLSYLYDPPKFAVCLTVNRTVGYLRCEFNASYSNTPIVPGPASLYLRANNREFRSRTMIYIPFPTDGSYANVTNPPPLKSCQELTNNCYGHGQCINEKCVCYQGYSEADDCNNPTGPIDIYKNNTNPTTTIGNNQSKFSFFLERIEEIDINEALVKTLNVSKWVINDLSTPQLVSIHYYHNHSNDPDPMIRGVNVSVVIEFSNQSRSVAFGPTTVQIGGGSIKVSVNVTNWQYLTFLTHLRVVFSTTINNEQYSPDSCSSSYDTFKMLYGTDDNVNYLRVIKDNVQYVGRFLNYSISDGRATFSKSQLISIVPLNSKESTAYIGLHLPQCNECLIDPDFSALVLSDKPNCNNKSSNDNTWKVIVGSVLGSAGGIVLAIGLYMVVKAKRHRIRAKMMSFGEKLRKVEHDG